MQWGYVRWQSRGRLLPALSTLPSIAFGRTRRTRRSRAALARRLIGLGARYLSTGWSPRGGKRARSAVSSSRLLLILPGLRCRTGGPNALGGSLQVEFDIDHI